MRDQANVYLKMSLLGKEVPCLVHTGCELTLVPKDLVSRFTNIEVRPSIHHVWAANNTPMRIKGEVRLAFELNEKMSVNHSTIVGRYIRSYARN